MTPTHSPSKCKIWMAEIDAELQKESQAYQAHIKATRADIIARHTQRIQQSLRSQLSQQPLSLLEIVEARTIHNKWRVNHIIVMRDFRESCLKAVPENAVWESPRKTREIDILKKRIRSIFSEDYSNCFISEGQDSRDSILPRR